MLALRESEDDEAGVCQTGLDGKALLYIADGFLCASQCERQLAKISIFVEEGLQIRCCFMQLHTSLHTTPAGPLSRR